MKKTTKLILCLISLIPFILTLYVCNRQGLPLWAVITIALAVDFVGDWILATAVRRHYRKVFEKQFNEYYENDIQP